MRRCGTCAEPVKALTARCPRCGRLWPYVGSRASKRPANKSRPRHFTRGKDCPMCGKRTERMRVPRHLRVIRLLLGSGFTYRDCRWCGWQGGAFHAPSDPTSASVADRPRERVRKRRSQRKAVDPAPADRPAASPPADAGE